MLNYEAKVLDALDMREAIINIVENLEKTRVKVKGITQEME